MCDGPCIIVTAEESKNQLDATYYFIVHLIGWTCFGHYYAHHQGLTTITLITTLVSFCKNGWDSANVKLWFLVVCVRCGVGYANKRRGLHKTRRIYWLAKKLRTPSTYALVIVVPYFWQSHSRTESVNISSVISASSIHVFEWKDLIKEETTGKNVFTSCVRLKFTASETANTTLPKHLFVQKSEISPSSIP